MLEKDHYGLGKRCQYPLPIEGDKLTGASLHWCLCSDDVKKQILEFIAVGKLKGSVSGKSESSFLHLWLDFTSFFGRPH